MRRTTVILISLALAIIACDPTKTQVALGGGGGATQQSPADANGDGLIDGVPDAVNNIFTLQELQDLEDAGLTVNTGDQPPDVEGAYLANTLAITYDSAGVQAALAAYLFTFYDQTADFTVQVDYSSDAGDASSGDLTYVAGTESCFSLFGDINSFDSANHCHYQTSTVYSGCIDSDNGVANFAYGFIMRELFDACTGFMAPGSMRIITETDGLATRH